MEELIRSLQAFVKQTVEEDLQSRFARFEERVKTTLEVIRSLKIAVEDPEARQRLELFEKDLMATNKSLESVRTELIAKLGELDSKVEGIDSFAKNSVDVMVENLKKFKEYVDENFAEVEGVFEKVRTSFKKLEEVLYSEEGGIKPELDALSLKVEKLDEGLADLQAVITGSGGLAESMKALIEAHNELVDALDGMQERIEVVENLMEEVNRLKRDTQRLEEELKKERESKRELEEKVKELTLEVAGYKAMTSALKERLGVMEELLSELSQKAQAYEQAYEEISREVSLVKAELKKVKEAVTRYLSAVSRMEARMPDVYKAIERMEEGMKVVLDRVEKVEARIVKKHDFPGL